MTSKEEFIFDTISVFEIRVVLENLIHFVKSKNTSNEDYLNTLAANLEKALLDYQNRYSKQETENKEIK